MSAKRLFRIGRAGGVERETEDEIRLHLELRIESLVRDGLTRKQAEAEAMRRFGSYDRARDDLVTAAKHRERVLTMIERLDSLRHDAAYALRQIRRTPVVAATVAATFALGIGANATMFGIVDRLLLRSPAHVAAPHEVVAVDRMVWREGQGYAQPHSYPVYMDLRDNVPGFQQVAMYTNPNDVSLGLGPDARRIRYAQVSGNYFVTLGTRIALGRPLLPHDDVLPTGSNVAVISYRFWRTALGADPGVIGTTIDLASRSFEVVGVAPANFVGTGTRPVDVWIPVSAAEGLRFGGAARAMSRNAHWVSIVARLAPGQSVPALSSQATAVVRGANEAARGRPDTTTLIALNSVLPREQRLTIERRVAILLAAVSGFVLLIACANVVNLLLARAARRRREIAVRLALGIGRSRLVRQLVMESMSLALLGGVAALAVVRWGSVVVQRVLFSEYAWPDSPLDYRVLMFIGFVAVVIGLFTGLVPALQASSPHLARALKEGSHGSGVSRSRTRSALLLAQASLSVVLLIGTGLFVRSLRNVDDVDFGLDIERLVMGTINLGSIRLDSVESDAYFRGALDLVTGIPGVEHATLASAPPFGNWAIRGTFTIPGRDSLPELDGLIQHGVLPGYFRAVGTRLVRGRDFNPDDLRRGVEPVIILNQEIARRLWPSENALGKCISLGRDAPCATIVGVAEDTHLGSVVQSGPPAQVYVPFGTTRDLTRTAAYVLIARPASGVSPDQLLAPVQRAMQSVRPGLPFAQAQPMWAYLDDELRPWRLGATMFGAFGAIALLLSALGLYAMVSYSVAQRTHELGVRVALGARRSDIARIVLWHATRPAAVGVLLGVVIALSTGGIMEPLLYEVSPRDPLVLGVAVVTLLSVALLASLLPARRATRAHPMEALRVE